MECVTVHLTSRPSRFTEHLLENYASMHNLHFPRLLSEGLTRFPRHVVLIAYCVEFFQVL
jgi:hypothetical protein